MSFLRHQQIYRPMHAPHASGTAFCAIPPSSSDESATGYSLASCTPALLASASPANRHGESVAGNRQPPLSRGWGILDRRNGDFSVGVDTNSRDALVSGCFAGMGE